jgi:hypothetical protein
MNDDLPPLPETAAYYGGSQLFYSAGQMREYARAARAEAQNAAIELAHKVARLEARAALAQPAGPCIGNDPLCPCQDGAACHYKDTPTTKGWPVSAAPTFNHPESTLSVLAQQHAAPTLMAAPVAWMHAEDLDAVARLGGATDCTVEGSDLGHLIPLYTSPQQPDMDQYEAGYKHGLSDGRAETQPAPQPVASPIFLVRSDFEQRMRADGHGPAALTWLPYGGYMSPEVQREWEAEKRRYTSPQPAPHEPFDVWQENPYTKVLMKSIAEDYMPRTAQPAPKPLSDEDIDGLMRVHLGYIATHTKLREFARAVLAAAQGGQK